MRVKQEFKICSLSIFSQGLYWNAFRSVTSKEQGRRHFGNCHWQYSILKSEDPEIESRLRLQVVRARPTPITPGRQRRLHLEAF